MLSALPWLVMICWYGVTPVGKARVAAVAAALWRRKVGVHTKQKDKGFKK